MRKLFFTVALLAAGTALFAQNLDDVQENISKNKYDVAKEKIDKVLADPKGQKSPNAWYYKAVIYNALSKDTTKDNSAFRKEAFDAYVKSLELDPKNVMGTLEQNVTLFDLHGQYLNSAIKAHNAKNYAAALENYKNAIAIQQYVNQKGFAYNNQSLPALDTAVSLYAGDAALQAKDTATGVQYLQQIADAKIGGKDYLQAYQILVDYYNRRGDQANAQKYAALGKELYPDNDYFTYYELSDPSLKADKAKLMAKYEDMLSRNPSDAGLSLDYAIELFNYTYGPDKPSDYKAAQEKLTTAISKAVDLNKSAEANYLMVQNISNQIYDLQEAQRAIKGTKPEDIKKKNAFTADINKRYEDLVKYGEAAVQLFSERSSDLKNVEKANYKQVLNQLANYYRFKKQADKAKTYEDRAKALG